MRISYAITVCNELEEIKKLIPHLLQFKREEDEIVILQDIRNRKINENVNLVWEYLHSVYRTQDITKFRLISEEFQGHFSEWKNLLNSFCKGSYIFQIDADEIPSQNLIENLPLLLESNPEVDLYWVPRINIVEEIGLSYIQKWGWNVDKNENFIQEKEFDLTNPKHLDEYNLLKKYNLIIE